MRMRAFCQGHDTNKLPLTPLISKNRQATVHLYQTKTASPRILAPSLNKLSRDHNQKEGGLRGNKTDDKSLVIIRPKAPQVFQALPLLPEPQLRLAY